MSFTEQDMDAALDWAHETGRKPRFFRVADALDKKSHKKVDIKVCDGEPGLMMDDGRTINLAGCAERKAKKASR